MIVVLLGIGSVSASVQPVQPRQEVENLAAFARLYGVMRYFYPSDDGRAISYAESVMGYVAGRKLATIVGRPTAGTNGNVATFIVPSGATVGFTGMRVSGHDGSAPFHLIGVKPHVPVTPTLAGLREGRDEVLERALAVANGK